MINIILVNYFSVEQVMQSILSLNGYDIRFVIVDNSSDFDASLINGMTNAYLLCSGKNLGYAGGNNLAVRFLRDNEFTGDYFILNPDVKISYDTIVELKRIADSDEKIGQIYCSAFDGFNNKLYDKIELFGLTQKWLVDGTGVIDSAYAAGSAMLVKATAIDSFLFDERFFLYWEEVDLSLRIKSKGFRVVVDSDSFCIRESNSISRRVNSVYYLVRNGLLINKLHSLGGCFTCCRYLSKMLICSCVFCFKTSTCRPLFLFFKGVIDYFRGAFGLLRQ
jgi:GT2 family glycosyltransferase